MDITDKDIKEIVLMLEEIHETLLEGLRTAALDRDATLRYLERLLKELSDDEQNDL